MLSFTFTMGFLMIILGCALPQYAKDHAKYARTRASPWTKGAPAHCAPPFATLLARAARALLCSETEADGWVVCLLSPGKPAPDATPCQPARTPGHTHMRAQPPCCVVATAAPATRSSSSSHTSSRRYQHY